MECYKCDGQGEYYDRSGILVKCKVCKGTGELEPAGQDQMCQGASKGYGSFPCPHKGKHERTVFIDRERTQAVVIHLCGHHVKRADQGGAMKLAGGRFVWPQMSKRESAIREIRNLVHEQATNMDRRGRALDGIAGYMARNREAILKNLPDGELRTNIRAMCQEFDAEQGKRPDNHETIMGKIDQAHQAGLITDREAESMAESAKRISASA